jgi:hypothetical protein
MRTTPFRNRRWLGFELSVLRRVKFNSIAIPFAGQPDLDWYLKFWGKQVLNNDVCQWAWWMSRALVENQEEDLSAGEVEQVLRDAYVPRRGLHNPALAQTLGELDACWFDNVWLNLQEIGNEYRRALAYLHALGVGNYVFSFTRETASLRRPLSEVFEALWQAQRKIVNNAQANRSTNLEAHEFMRETRADLMFARFPRPEGLAALRDTLVGWREMWTRGTPDCWDALIEQRRGQLGDRVASKERYLKLIGNFLAAATHVPNWAIAHAEDGFVTAGELCEVIKTFRRIEVTYNKDFSDVLGGLNTYIIIAG